jgi:hypothetical protein
MLACKLLILVYIVLLSDGFPVPSEEDENPDNRAFSAADISLKRDISVNSTNWFKDYHDPTPDDFGEFEDYLCFGGKIFTQ